MALQVCSRCRKRRIRCDLKLPACKNCRLADVDCMFWDDSLGQEFPCSYLHSLQQKVQSLQQQIQQATDQASVTSTATAYEVNAEPYSRQSYHLEIADHDDLPSPSRTAYLGPGSSAQLMQRLLTSTANWYLSNNIQISRHLLLDDRSLLSGFWEPPMVPSFLITNDLRKVELHSLVPPSTQRAIIEHYLKIVAPQYTLLPVEQESALLTHENPLKWTSSNKDDPAAFALTIVFAISTALITRDLDPNLANASLRSREDVQKLSLGDVASQNQLSATRWTCTALCALSLSELIWPTSGQLWDLLGRAATTMQDLRQVCQTENSEWDTDLKRLERALLKLESLATMHFGRPSLFFHTHLQLYLKDLPAPIVISDELYVASCLHSISHALTTEPAPTESFLETLIPLSLQVSSLDSEIALSSATLYAALHPLLTNSYGFAGGGIFDIPSEKIIRIIAKSASVIIDHFSKLNESNMIVSIWLASEKVLEAGAIWAASLIHQQRLSGPKQYGVSTTGTGVALSPIVKVSSLLASFAARWKAGSVYVNTWEIVVELLWKMV